MKTKKQILINMSYFDGKIIGVSGSRTIDFISPAYQEKIKRASMVVHGGAPGFDRAVDYFCKMHNIPTQVIRPADPSNKFHYLIRNEQIVNMSDVMLCMWDGKSKGTKYTYDYANKQTNKLVFLEVIEA